MVKKAMVATGFFCLLLVLGTQTTMAQFGQMTGVVKDEDGKPMPDAIVSIDREDIKGHYEVKTDKNGKYFHAGLPLGRFTVTVKQRNGQDYSIRGVQTKMSEPVNVQIDLQQARMQAEAAAAGMEVPKEQGGRLTQEQMAAIQKAAKEREEQIKKRQALTSKFDIAMEAMKAKNYDAAIPEFQAAAEVDPTQHVVFAQLGEAYSGKASQAKNPAEKKEWYEKSVDAYQKAITLKADDASYHNNFALALANGGKVDEAQAELLKAAQMDPPNAGRYYFNLGAVLINTNHLKEATEAFRQATTADPNFADAYYQLGVTLTGMATMDSSGKVVPVPGTKEALEKYLELAPSGPNADAAKSLLDTMGGAVTTKIDLSKEKKK